MNLNQIIQPERESIAEINEALQSEKYFVDNSFQRRQVWTLKQKARLIETVLTGYPMPEIYVWEQTPNPETGKQNFSIVDGQQRLTAINQFIANEWLLKSSYLHTENTDASFSGKFWKDLSPDEKNDIWQYKINVRKLPSSIDIEQVRKVFTRLNETDRSLNPQELRNAEFNGEFISAAAEIADSSQLACLDIFSVNDVRRMRDVEFGAQMLGYERRGIADDAPRNMNRMYDQFNDIYEERAEDTEKIMGTIDIARELFETPEIRKVFGSANNLYTLHCLLDSEDEDHPFEYWSSALYAFSTAYLDTEVENRDIDEFREGASSRTRSRSSRLKRLTGLLNWIKNNS